ncbi:hypothetical protein KEM56_005409 [Ascosphaera pollenicola]|nr:hypothetical protein KEM56_005409 [Ascosphaera pollenicola]
MFILTTISDLIQISPEDFSKSSAVAIEDNINAKYANKVRMECDAVATTQNSFAHVDIGFVAQVIQNVGLCIGMYDMLESSDGLIGHGTGLVNVNGARILPTFSPGRCLTSGKQ